MTAKPSALIEHEKGQVDVLGDVVMVDDVGCVGGGAGVSVDTPTVLI